MPYQNSCNSRYLWIKNLPNRTNIDDLTAILQSTNNHGKTAIVTCKDAGMAAKIHEVGVTLHKTNLELEFCDSKGNPINDYSADSSKSSSKRTVNTPIPLRSRSTSNDSSYEDNRSKAGGNNQTSDNRGLAVSNLPKRSSSNNLREGLFHEFKKFGKITSVIIDGQGAERVALITFKRGEDADKAYEASQNKVFFRTQIKVEKALGADVEDPDLCPPEHVMDEYHPKATKTLFVGNLCANTITKEDLHDVFEKYGEIIEIDIKIQANQLGTSYAFVQFVDIKCVVTALNDQENVRVNNKTVKLGFGKSQPTNVVWLDNLASGITENYLKRHFSRFGRLNYVIVDEKLMRALVYFDNPEVAQRALNEARNRPILNRKVQIDFASQECQIAFIKKTVESNPKSKGSSEKLQQIFRLLRFNSNFPLFDENKKANSGGSTTGPIDSIVQREPSTSGAESSSYSPSKHNNSKTVHVTSTASNSSKIRRKHRDLTPISTTSGDANYSCTSDSDSSPPTSLHSHRQQLSHHGNPNRTGTHYNSQVIDSHNQYSGSRPPPDDHRPRSRHRSHRRYSSTERSSSIHRNDFMCGKSTKVYTGSSSISKNHPPHSPPMAYSHRETSHNSRDHSGHHHYSNNSDHQHHHSQQHRNHSRSRVNGSLPKSYSKTISSTSKSGTHAPRSIGDEHSPNGKHRSKNSSSYAGDSFHNDFDRGNTHSHHNHRNSDHSTSGHRSSKHKDDLFELSPTSSSASIKSPSRNYSAANSSSLLDYIRPSSNHSNTLVANAKKVREDSKEEVNELSKLNQEKAALLRELSLLAGHSKNPSRSPSPGVNQDTNEINETPIAKCSNTVTAKEDKVTLDDPGFASTLTPVINPSSSSPQSNHSKNLFSSNQANINNNNNITSPNISNYSKSASPVHLDNSIMANNVDTTLNSLHDFINPVNPNLSGSSSCTPPPPPPKISPSKATSIITPVQPIRREDKLKTILTGADYHPLAQAFLQHSTTSSEKTIPDVKEETLTPQFQSKAKVVESKLPDTVTVTPTCSLPDKSGPLNSSLQKAQPILLDSVDERIRLLDQELMKTEKVRPVVDYSKFRIRRKNQTITPLTTSTTSILNNGSKALICPSEHSSTLNTSSTTNSLLGFDIQRSSSLLCDISAANVAASPTGSMSHRFKGRIKSPNSSLNRSPTIDSNDFIKSMLSSTKTSGQTIPSLYSANKPLTSTSSSSWANVNNNSMSNNITLTKPTIHLEEIKEKSPDLLANISTNEIMKRIDEDFKSSLPEKDEQKSFLETKPKRESYEQPQTLKTESSDMPNVTKRKSQPVTSLHDAKHSSLNSSKDVMAKPVKVKSEAEPETKTIATKTKRDNQDNKPFEFKSKPTTTNRLPWEPKPDIVLKNNANNSMSQTLKDKPLKIPKVKKANSEAGPITPDANNRAQKPFSQKSEAVTPSLKKKRDPLPSVVPTKKRRLLSNLQDQSASSMKDNHHHHHTGNTSANNEKVFKRKMNISSSSYENSSHDDDSDSLSFDHERNFNLYESMYDKIKRRASKDNPAAIVSNVLERQNARNKKHKKKDKKKSKILSFQNDSDSNNNDDSNYDSLDDEKDISDDNEATQPTGIKQQNCGKTLITSPSNNNSNNRLSAIDRQKLLRQLSVSSTSSSDEGFIPKATPAAVVASKGQSSMILPKKSSQSEQSSKKSKHLTSKSFQEDSLTHKTSLLNNNNAIQSKKEKRKLPTTLVMNAKESQLAEISGTSGSASTKKRKHLSSSKSFDSEDADDDLKSNAKSQKKTSTEVKKKQKSLAQIKAKQPKAFNKSMDTDEDVGLSFLAKQQPCYESSTDSSSPKISRSSSENEEDHEKDKSSFLSFPQINKALEPKNNQFDSKSEQDKNPGNHFVGKEIIIEDSSIVVDQKDQSTPQKAECPSTDNTDVSVTAENTPIKAASLVHESHERVKKESSNTAPTLPQSPTLTSKTVGLSRQDQLSPSLQTSTGPLNVLPVIATSANGQVLTTATNLLISPNVEQVQNSVALIGNGLQAQQQFTLVMSKEPVVEQQQTLNSIKRTMVQHQPQIPPSSAPQLTPVSTSLQNTLINKSQVLSSSPVNPLNPLNTLATVAANVIQTNQPPPSLSSQTSHTSSNKPTSSSSKSSSKTPTVGNSNSSSMANSNNLKDKNGADLSTYVRNVIARVTQEKEGQFNNSNSNNHSTGSSNGINSFTNTSGHFNSPSSSSIGMMNSSSKKGRQSKKQLQQQQQSLANDSLTVTSLVVGQPSMTQISFRHGKTSTSNNANNLISSPSQQMPSGQTTTKGNKTVVPIAAKPQQQQLDPYEPNFDEDLTATNVTTSSSTTPATSRKIVDTNLPVIMIMPGTSTTLTPAATLPSTVLTTSSTSSMIQLPVPINTNPTAVQLSSIPTTNSPTSHLSTHELNPKALLTNSSTVNNNNNIINHNSSNSVLVDPQIQSGLQSAPSTFVTGLLPQQTQQPQMTGGILPNGSNIEQIAAQFGVNPLAYIYSLFAQQQQKMNSTTPPKSTSTTPSTTTPGVSQASGNQMSFISPQQGLQINPSIVMQSQGPSSSSQQQMSPTIVLTNSVPTSSGMQQLQQNNPIVSTTTTTAAAMSSSPNSLKSMPPVPMMQTNQQANAITLDLLTSALAVAAAQQQQQKFSISQNPSTPQSVISNTQQLTNQPTQQRSMSNGPNIPPSSAQPSTSMPPMISILSPQRPLSVPDASSVPNTPLSAISFSADPSSATPISNPVQLLNSIYEASISPSSSSKITTATTPQHQQQQQQVAFKSIINLPSNESVVTNFTSVWRGRLLLKNEEFQSQMFHLAGNSDLFNLSLRTLGSDSFCKNHLDQHGRSSVLKIVQRMRFDPKQLEGVNRKLRQPSEHVICLALSEPVQDQQIILKNSFIRYLNEKSAAGIINVTHPISNENLYIVHIFPPCEFTSNLFKDIPSGSLLLNALMEKSMPFLVVIVTTV